MPRISVVVPFHNNSDVLGPCLKSLAAQSFGDFEVVMVDDGSADGGAAVAAAQASADPRFTLVQVAAGGPGFARNQGIRRATGEYLSFVDGDDLLPADALERLLATLQASGSDFVSGNVQRLGPHGAAQSALHARAVKTRKIGTHISRSPELFFDVSVWNKLFRRSFWDNRQLVFPEGVVWEDLQLMTKAHVLARAVDVIPEHIYYWRERTQGELSITQSRASIDNFRDRITALLVIDEFLREHRPRRMVREHQHKALVNDLWLYVLDLGRTDEDYCREYADLMISYLGQVDGRALSRLPSTHKLAYHLTYRRLMPELLHYVAWLNEQPVKTVPVVRERGRIWADLPYRTDRRLGIPAVVYRTQPRELDPFVRVEQADWEDGKLVISGCAYVPSIDIRKRRQTSKIVLLRPRQLGRPPVIVPAESFRHPDAQQWSGQHRYNYSWAGFSARISPRWFRLASGWLTGDWDGYVLVRGRGAWRPARLHTPVRAAAERPGARQVAPGVRLGARWVDKRLWVQVTRTPAELSGCTRHDQVVVLQVDLRELAARAAPRLVLVPDRGVARRELATTASALPSGGVRLRGVMPAGLLGDGPGPDSAADTAAGPDGPAEWDLFVEDGSGRTPVAFPAGGRDYRFPAGSDEVAVERTRYGNVVVAMRSTRPVITDQSWSADGRLTLRGQYAARPGQAIEAVLTRVGAAETHGLAVDRDGDRFSVTVDASGMPSFGIRQPLRDGDWELKVRLAGPDLITPGYDQARLAQAGGARRQFGPKLYRFTTAGRDRPVLAVTPALRTTEDGRAQRGVLRRLYYPLQQRRGLRDSVLFVSFKGRQAGDNPLGIAAELRRRGDGRQHIWLINDWSVPVPDGARPVLLGTEACWDALARSAYIVSNDDMPRGYQKRPGQFYLQTWHGTPLKRVGFDIASLKLLGDGEYKGILTEDITRWDTLLSPSPFSTPILQRAFRFGGDVLESGYPRNDVLATGDRPAIAAQVRERIGIPASKRVVLYAPTWRDNQSYGAGRYRFDFRLDLERAWHHLGDEYAILVRGHHQTADDGPVSFRPGFAFNVTGYPDVSELLLACDALITDYSSMMCDFAVTGRPMVFFTYDLQEYRDDVRGLYVDLEAEAPGPLLATSDEVIDAIGDLDAIGARYSDSYAAFTAKFCPLDDGKAGARVCDRIFGGGSR